MSFRCPSDAQARALQRIAEYGEVIWIPPHASRESVYGRSVAILLFEVDDREAETSCLQRDYGDRIRIATVYACVRYEWLRVGVRVFASGLPIVGVYHPVGGEKSVVTRVLALSDDGELALGLWGERKLKAAPVPLAPLSTREREMVALATHAHAAGFVLLPATDAAKRECRRLARTPYAQRGWGAGAGTRSLLPTALGKVEVMPEQADRVEIVENRQ